MIATLWWLFLFEELTHTFWGIKFLFHFSDNIRDECKFFWIVDYVNLVPDHSISETWFTKWLLLDSVFLYPSYNCDGILVVHRRILVKIHVEWSSLWWNLYLWYHTLDMQMVSTLHQFSLSSYLSVELHLIIIGYHCDLVFKLSKVS